MRWWFSKHEDTKTRSAGIELPVIAPERMIAERRGELETIWGRVRVSEALRGVLFDAPVLRFAEQVMTLPASEAHHDAEPGGLFKHTLRAAEKIEEDWEPPNPGLAAMKERYFGYVAFLAALLHDLGKVFSVRVNVGTSFWNPLKETLWEFARGHRVVWANHVTGPERLMHEALGTIFLKDFMTPEVVEFIGLPAVAKIGGFLLRGQRGESKLENAVAKADIQVATIASPMEDLKILFKHIRDQYAKGRLLANCAGGQLFCGEKFTLVAMPRGFVPAIGPANEELAKLGRGSICSETRHTRLMGMLAASGAAFTYAKDSVIVRADLQDKVQGLAGVLVANELLWEHAQVPGRFEGTVAICSRDGKTALVVPGFTREPDLFSG